MNCTCLKKDAEQWPVGAIALAGVHFEAEGRSLSGHNTDVASQLHRLEDGGVFIDKRAVPERKIVRLVASGPMLKVGMDPNSIERFKHRGALERMLPGLSGGFDTLAEIALANNDWRGFDYVGLNVHCKMWLDAGARVGKRDGDKIHWLHKDGHVETEDIQPCSCWKGVCLGCNRLRYYVDTVPDGMMSKTREVSGPDDHCPACKKADEEKA